VEVIKDLLLRMADDELIAGHRMSEWTGIGPVMEEDIAFSSMSQDKVGHALANYTILNKEFNMPDPDKLAFGRAEKDFHCSHFVELPIGEYDFSLVRHFLFDHAEFLRYELLSNSSFMPLAQLAKKIKGELKYHILHADIWIARLGKASDESKARMQSSLNELYVYALCVFEPGNFEKELIEQNIFVGEKKLQELWIEKISAILKAANLSLPNVVDKTKEYGGRKGYHTTNLQPLLNEMNEVVNSEDITIEW
jgi:ring-1,2-phenylacetyl-CoA epoxidase subunit PaaC